MAKTCPKCGNLMDDNARFCDECGTVLEDTQIPLNNSTNTASREQENPQIDMFSGNVQPVNYQTPKINDNSTLTVSTKVKVLGIVSLVSGILSIITLGGWIIPEILAIVCGRKSKNTNGRMTKTGKLGFICGIIGCVMLVLLVVLAFIV